MSVVELLGIWQLVHSASVAGWLSCGRALWQETQTSLILAALAPFAPWGSWHDPHQSFPPVALTHLLSASCSTWLTALTAVLSPPRSTYIEKIASVVPPAWNRPTACPGSGFVSHLPDDTARIYCPVRASVVSPGSQCRWPTGDLRAVRQA